MGDSARTGGRCLDATLTLQAIAQANRTAQSPRDRRASGDAVARHRGRAGGATGRHAAATARAAATRLAPIG